MGSVNKHIIVGNLGADPESFALPSGNSVVNLRVATTDTWRDKQSGERREATEWHSVKIFNEQLGKIAMQFLKKGSQVYLEGKSKTRSYEKDGVKHYATDLVLENYNGQLTMLGSANGSGDDDDTRDFDGKQARNDTYQGREDRRESDRGSRDDDRGNARGNDRNDNRGRGDSNNGNRGASQDRSGNGGGSRNNDPDRFKKDIDDEIPF